MNIWLIFEGFSHQDVLNEASQTAYTRLLLGLLMTPDLNNISVERSCNKFSDTHIFFY